jgi:hypothetical protein
MPAYQRKDARAWARQHLVGCSAVTIPSYSADLKRLNERGIRHDVELAIRFGYRSTLLCSRGRDHYRRERAVHRLGTRDRGQPASAVLPRRLRYAGRQHRGSQARRSRRCRLRAAVLPVELLAHQRTGHLRLHARPSATPPSWRVMLFPIPHLGLRARAPGGHVGGPGAAAAARTAPTSSPSRPSRAFRCRPGCARCTTTSATRWSSAAPSKATPSR